MPDQDVTAQSGLSQFCRWLALNHDLRFTDYDSLWHWSVDNLEDFWRALWKHFDVTASKPFDAVLRTRDMPAKWFEGALLNYAEHAVGSGEATQLPAIIAHSHTREPIHLTFDQLRGQVARARAGLKGLGVRAGDRVVAYLPNIPAVSGYRYGDRVIDRTETVAEICAALPSLEFLVDIPYAIESLSGALPWNELTAREEPIEYEQVPFAHPLYVLFSSGTTGLPKAIVHGHGGILLEHLKLHAFHMDTRPGDRLMWFTTTGWMMWNLLISGLARDAAVVLVDGDPLWPDVTAQWRLASESGATLLGTSPDYITLCRREGVRPDDDFDLGSLRQVGVSGAPLAPEGFDWIQASFAGRVVANSMSGGTDVCSAFVAGNPWLPVYCGEIAGPCLGVDVAAVDSDGKEVIDELGELVIRQPMPSMPIGFWNDPENERYCSSYFDTFPGVWRHGDWALFRERGSCLIAGRSDATLNRGGVRLGTSEFYGVVEKLASVRDSLIVHLEDADGGRGELLLFVSLNEATPADEGFREQIRGMLREQLSPRHVPDKIIAVPSIPRTLTGKKLEKPIKQVLLGRPVDEVVQADALAEPTALEPFVQLARNRYLSES